ncbi:MAG: hypothetical protein LKE27_00085 [Atopobiaceae bacterium]|jgi:hypothetical protein|nr:hypothetical protein [Atopobiaceae bacterium]MCI2050645.1 hypothetical protein [Atopobiaceae bacterium]
MKMQRRHEHLALVAVAVAAAFIAVITVLFRMSLTDIDGKDADRLPSAVYEVRYLPKRYAALSDADEVEQAWTERYGSDGDVSLTPAQKSAALGMQLSDPGEYADAILVVTATAESHYGYRAFACSYHIDSVIRGLGKESRLLADGAAFALPEVQLNQGDEIVVYQEFAVSKDGQSNGGSGLQIGASSTRSPYTGYLTPTSVGRQYLVFLCCLPSDAGSVLPGCRFMAAPTVYSVLPLQDTNGSLSLDLNIMNAGFPESPYEATEAAPLNSRTQSARDEAYENAYAETASTLEEQNYADAMDTDMYVETDETEALFRSNAQRIADAYLL